MLFLISFLYVYIYKSNLKKPNIHKPNKTQAILPDVYKLFIKANNGKIHNLTTKSLHHMLNLIYMQIPVDDDGSACLDPEQHAFFFCFLFFFWLV